MQPYDTDLAYIHDAGYALVADRAGEILKTCLAQLPKPWQVVDLGCGTGRLLSHLASSVDVLHGVDISPAMIALARQAAPSAHLTVAPVFEYELPVATAFCATGEVLNYCFAGTPDDAALSALFQRVHAALSPGGFFLLDVATSERAPSEGVRQGFREGPDWCVLVEGQADGDMLSRRIVTFRERGGHWRRSEETHIQRLLHPERVSKLLEQAGFVAEQLPVYKGFAHAGLAVFLARRL